MHGTGPTRAGPDTAPPRPGRPRRRPSRRRRARAGARPPRSGLPHRPRRRRGAPGSQPGSSSLQHLRHLVRHGNRFAVGSDPVRRQLSVHGVAFPGQAPQIDRALHEGARDQAYPLPQLLRRRLEPHDDSRGPKTLPVRLAKGRSPAARHNRGRRSCDARHGGLLQVAESLLALLAEDVGDRHAGIPLDLLVEVHERSVQDLGERPPHRALPRAGHPDQVHVLVHGCNDDTKASRFRIVSATESPPNFSSAASASTEAAMASPTTAPAGTAHTSVRCVIASAASPVSTSTVRSGRGSVDSGFMATRTRTTSPLLMPPSMPPARSVTRRKPSSPRTISSWASDPRRPALAKPSPTPTPFTDWMLISASASLASSFRSKWTCDPNPGGTPYARTSNTPPSESPSRRATSMAATIRSAESGSAQRTGDPSIASRSSGRGVAAPDDSSVPIWTTWERTSIPSSARKALQKYPRATRVAVSRALARSRMSRASSAPYFCIPARSACPGRGRGSRSEGSGSPK